MYCTYTRTHANRGGPDSLSQRTNKMFLKSGRDFHNTATEIDYTARCKAILAENKQLDMVMVTDKYANIMAKASSSCRKARSGSCRRRTLSRRRFGAT